MEPRFAGLTVVYLAVIYGLSSIPDLGSTEQDPLVLLLFNLGHIPLFAGLAFCVLKSLSAVSFAPRIRYALAFTATAACGASDEWHQSFVPGRTCSLGDFLLDLAGIAALLLLVHLQTMRRDRRSTTPSRLCWLRHS